jgi:hypothetical protein
MNPILGSMGQAVRLPRLALWMLSTHDFHGKTLQLGIFLTAGTRMWRSAPR